MKLEDFLNINIVIYIELLSFWFHHKKKLNNIIVNYLIPR